jgi:hypothetical protein
MATMRVGESYKSGFRVLMAVLVFTALAIRPSSVLAESSTPARTLVERTLDAMGVGRDVRKLQTLRATTQSVTFDIVENDHPDLPFPIQGFATATVVDDLPGGRQVSTTSSDGDVLSRLVFTTDAQFTETTRAGKRTVGKSIPPPPSWETQDPLRALLLARSASDLALDPDQVVHGSLQHVISMHNGPYAVRIFIDAQFGLPTATEATIALNQGASGSVAWNSWGDITDRAEFLIYDLKDGLRYPTQVDLYRNGVHLRVTQRTDLRLDAVEDRRALSELTAPAPATALDMDEIELGQVIGPDPKSDVTEIAPGIVQFPGSWYTTLVVQDDGIVVLDAPISAGYSKRLLAEAARRFPGVPVKAVVTSTAFFWHIGGVREYAARGIPIYVRDRNAPIVQALLAAPHTMAPDALSKTSVEPDLRLISKPIVIGSGRHAITVMPVRFGEQPMLMSWIADAHLLHTGEMVQPLGPNGSLLFPEALLEITRSVAAEKIPQVGLRIIGMHMSPTPWSAVGEALESYGVTPM